MRIELEHFSKRFGSFTAVPDMNLVVDEGEMLALLGPSGCGKTTTLFAISGILKVDGGRIRIGGRDVTDLPAQRRNVGVVFQSYALYPHMTARENIAFPLKLRRADGATIGRLVEELARLLEIEALLERRPAQMSGGQQQRVALARALVRRPDVLLLDEPLANLDARLRLDMRGEIRRIQRETRTTSILVTHDQVEAMSMCDRIAILDKGEIAQIATPSEMYERPANRFVASFLGSPPIAYLEATAEPGGMRLACTGALVPWPSGVRQAQAGAPITVGVRPESFGPARPVRLPGRVASLESHGREMLYAVDLPGGTRLRAIGADLGRLDLGASVDWGIDPAKLLVFDKDGARL
jgi:inositol-phosphate transport system ATP-binding protein